MKKPRIIGIGSPSGDDQAGWLVVDTMKSRLPPEVELIQLDRPGSALIPLLENTSHVILIDAMQGGGQPGDIHHFINDEWENYGQGLSSHGLGVFDALMLAKELDCLPETLDLYGIEIGSALPGDPASEAIISAAEQLAERITQTWQHVLN